MVTLDETLPQYLFFPQYYLVAKMLFVCLEADILLLGYLWSVTVFIHTKLDTVAINY